MAKIYFFNVGHGESILIKYPNLRIIRDFGRSRHAQDTAFSCQIRKLAHHWMSKRMLCVNDDTTDIAILSHFHEDHFNGFIELHEKKERKIFKRAYIPWLSFDNLKSIGSFILQVNLLLARSYFYKPYYASVYKNTLKIIPVLFDLSEELCCIGAGYSFSEIPDKNNVYWPPLNQNDVASKDWDNFNDIMRSCLNEQNINNFIDDSQQLLEQISSLVNKTNALHDPNSIIKTINIISQKALDKRLTTNQLKKLKKISSKYIDNSSIIFDIENKALFLSDAYDNCVRNALNGITAYKYKYIKAGHHGNRGDQVLQELNFKSNEVICCCGPAHSSWKGPSRNYLAIGSTYCTDWNNKSKKWLGKAVFRFENKNVFSRCWI